MRAPSVQSSSSTSSRRSISGGVCVGRGLDDDEDEEEELEFKVDYEDGSQLILSVGYEEKPGQFHRLNSYGIDRKKGTAEPVIGKEIISLW